jgi:hypothetical protein
MLCERFGVRGEIVKDGKNIAAKEPGMICLLIIVEKDEPHAD